MGELAYRLEDRGDSRVLTMGGRTHQTRYSTRVIEKLIERKGARAPLYFPFKEERAPRYLDPLFRWLRALGARDLAVLEVGCSFGHMTEYLAEQPEVATITTFDTDGAFVEIVQAKREEMQLAKLRDVRLFSNDQTRRLPWPDGAFDLVLAIGVVEHLPQERREQVDEYYRVLAPGGHIAILDTPNKLFPLETHSIGLPFVQWLPPAPAYRYARLRRKFRRISYDVFVAEGTGWHNATLRECLPSSGLHGLVDVTEDAGYGWRFFCDTARSATRWALLPLFAIGVALLRTAGLSPSLCLPYFNLLFRKRPLVTPGA